MLSLQFLRYILVGLVSAGVDIGGVYGLLALSLDYRLAVTLGFSASLVVNYLLHNYFTFAAPSMNWGQVGRYSVVVWVNYLITMAIVWVGHEVLLQPVILAKIVSLPVIAVNGYYLCRAWVFSERP